MSIRKIFTLLQASVVDYLAIIIFSLGIALLSFTQIYFHQVYQYSVMQASILLGAASIGQFLGSLLSSAYVRFIKKSLSNFGLNSCHIRFSIFILTFIISVLFVGFGLNQSYYIFIALSFLLGVTLALFGPINMTLLTTNIDLSETVIVTFLRRWMLNIGACVAFGMMGYLLSHPKRLFYSVATIFLFISFLEFLRLFKKETENYAINENQKNINFGHISKSVWLWMFAVFLSYVIFFQTISIYPIFLKDYVNIDTSGFSQLMVLSVVIVLILQFITPILEKRMSISTISALGTLLIGIGIAIITLKSNVIIYISVVIWSVGEIFLLGVTPVYAKIFSGNDREKNLKYSSNYYAMCYAGKVLGPLAASFLYSYYHFQASLLVAFFFLSAFVAFCFYYLGLMIEKNKIVIIN